MIIYIATGNKHKIEEIKQILKDEKEIEIKPITDIGPMPEVNENGDSFYENALKKAIIAGEKYNVNVIADDSGLIIDALNGLPGIRSSRFLSHLDYKERMKEILKMIREVEFEKRTARFVCSAVYFSPKKGIILGAKGIVEGKIAFEIRGDKGFGYDPIFIPNGYDKTFGEIGYPQKHEISHRSKAFRKLIALIKVLEGGI